MTTREQQKAIYLVENIIQQELTEMREFLNMRFNRLVGALNELDKMTEAQEEMLSDADHAIYVTARLLHSMCQNLAPFTPRPPRGEPQHV
jgi:hypothetical protein